MNRSLLPLSALSLLLLGGCSTNDKDIVSAASYTPPPPAANLSSALGPSTPAPDADAWPRVTSYSGSRYTIYQPQLDAWDGLTLEARAAVAVTAEGSNNPTYGIIFVRADTTVDREERSVHLENLKVTEAQFPGIADSRAYLERFQSFLPKDLKAISLDRLEASLTISQAQSKPIDLRNPVPGIVFATKPTLLVPVDGTPTWAATGSPGLDYIVNSRALFIRDTTGTVYLHLFDGYVSAPSLAGPWAVPAVLPPTVEQAKDKLVASKQVDLLSGQPDPETQKMPSLATNGVPALRVTTAATELILTEGEPQWVAIPGTQLQFIDNTPSHVFKDVAHERNYILLSGRWFTSRELNGPWTHVPGRSLPDDFKKIPDDSLQENVKASVPGTPQAAEAVITTGIPTTTKMDRATAQMNPLPTYDGGAPQLTAIEGSTLMYAANTATPVIRVNDQSWFACENGVWFTANSPHGPWAIADAVPPAIYTIPASCPLFYVTYVRVYRADAKYVWVGYTPGYYGALIGPDGTVVYGTGYDYPPYVSSAVYVAYAATYGYGSNLAYTPWSGWAFGFAVGYCWGAPWDYWACMPPAPYWGPYWGYCYGWGYNAAGGITAWGPYGWAGTSGNIYSQHGPWSGVSRYQGGFNAWTGNRWASQYGRAYNSTTGTSAIGARGAVANIYTGNYGYGSRGAAYNENSGNAAWGSRGTVGNAGTGNEISGARGGYYNSETGEITTGAAIRGENGGVARLGDDVYAGHDGNIYKKTDGGWSQVSPPRPSGGPAERPSASPHTASSLNQSSLNQDYAARQMGNQRAQSYQATRPAFHGGGGFRGGGRR